MKNEIKIFTILLTVVISVLYFNPPVFAEQKPIGVYLDGVQVTFDITNGVQDQALTIYDYAYVPIARIIEILTGSRPVWDDYAKTSTYRYNGKTYVIDTTENGIYFDGFFIESVTGTPPVIVNDRMMIPLKMLSSVMGFEQRYDAVTHSTFLKTPGGITPVQTVPDVSSKESVDMWDILDNIEALVEEEIAVAAREGNIIELKERLGLSDEEIVAALLKYSGTSSGDSKNKDVSFEEAANFMRELREKEIASLAKEGNVTELKERIGLSDEEIVAAILKYGGTSAATTTNTAGVPKPKDFTITIKRPNAGKKNDHIDIVFSWEATTGVEGTRLSSGSGGAKRSNDIRSIDGNSRKISFIGVDTTPNANKTSIDIVTAYDYALCFFTTINGKQVFGEEVRPTAIIDERNVTYDAKGTPISRTATISTPTPAPLREFVTVTPTPAPSTDVATDRAPITWVINGSSSTTPAVNVGDTVHFGDYNWRVLDVRNGSALLLSDRIIKDSAMYFGGGQGFSRWDTSDLRKYLNSDFYKSFTTGEQSRITLTTVTTDEGEGRSTASDRIFLLNVDEVNRYLSTNASRVAVNSDGSAEDWWLRESGDKIVDPLILVMGSYKTFYYDIYKVITADGSTGIKYSDQPLVGVRPAMWVDTAGGFTGASGN